MPDKTISLIILDGLYTIHRLPPDANVPKAVYASPFSSITHSGDEMSIVSHETVQVQSEKSQPGWAVMRMAGTLDFALVGLLAEIAAVLAKAKVSIFAVSTYDTDYILVKNENLKAAREALTAAGYKVTRLRAKREEKPSGLKDAATALLEKQIPLIRALMVEKVTPAVISTLKNPMAIGVVVGSLYEFLPAAVRIIVSRQTFVDFCIKNIDILLPEHKTPAGKPAPKGKKSK